MSELKDIFKEAAEIVQELPDHLQPTAFALAIDRLLNGAVSPIAKHASKRSRGAVAKNRPAATPQAVRRTVASGLTPKSAILWLVETGFLVNAKTGREVQEYLQQKRGYDLDADSLRKAMLRLVRDDVLERDKNDDGEYIYSTATVKAAAIGV